MINLLNKHNGFGVLPLVAWPCGSVFALLFIGLMGIAATPSLANDRPTSDQWDGLWFECEFAGKQAPPADGCAMLDDDGFLFDGNRVTYMKMLNSPETDACKKQRVGQCFQASMPQITVKEERKGTAEFTDTTIGLKFLGCTQIFHTTAMDDFIEAKPDQDRCFWAGKKHFYLRQYQGDVEVQ